MAPPSTFDYRKLISNKERKADWYSDYQQAGFDTINRMASLYGDIPFEELFARPLAVVIPRLQANLNRTRPDLIKYPCEVLDLFDTLLETGANRTFYDLVHSKRGEYPEELEKAIHVLRLRHGIYLPVPNYYRPKNYHRAMEDLVEYAGKRNYRDVFRKCKCKMDPNEKSAIWYAIRDRIIFQAGNGMCCNASDKCQSGTGSCTEQVGFGGSSTCSSGSSNCSPPPRPKPKSPNPQP